MSHNLVLDCGTGLFFQIHKVQGWVLSASICKFVNVEKTMIVCSIYSCVSQVSVISEWVKKYFNYILCYQKSEDLNSVHVHVGVKWVYKSWYINMYLAKLNTLVSLYITFYWYSSHCILNSIHIPKSFYGSIQQCLSINRDVVVKN